MSMSITKITSFLQDIKKDTTVIGLAGGSASGKSFLSDQLSTWGKNNGYDVVVLHQDDFALGRQWRARHSSRYRWDDPENYRLNEAYDVLNDLLHGKVTTFLAYDLDAHEPHLQKTLAWQYADAPSGRRLVIIEGLFAWRRPFDILVDVKVFLEVNFWHRYVLRLQRNAVEMDVADFQKVTEQYFTFVADAHGDLLEPEKVNADIVIENAIDIGMIPSMEHGSDQHHGDVIFADDMVSISVSEGGIVRIANANGILFCQKVPEAIIDKMKAVKKL